MAHCAASTLLTFSGQWVELMHRMLATDGCLQMQSRAKEGHVQMRHLGARSRKVAIQGRGRAMCVCAHAREHTCHLAEAVLGA